ncbi:MAG: hypothetical protein OXP12_09640 [Thaumarchaeota archaeon]|nr:hypothetical protein [Nitrososphaerota archaeon]MDE0266178.1 hypothetical protein [Nitrososphaerota archaeon]
MSRWKKGAREFEMNVNHNGLGSHLCRIPKPIMEMLGYPEKVRFTVKGKKVTFTAGDDQ